MIIKTIPSNLIARYPGLVTRVVKLAADGFEPSPVTLERRAAGDVIPHVEPVRLSHIL
jgi:hypothetical protein